MNEVLSSPEQFFIRCMAGRDKNKTYSWADLSQDEQQTLTGQIKFSPVSYFARPKQPLATTPSLGPDLSIQPQSVVCRFFVCAFRNDNQDGYCVMPGGLAMNLDDRGKYIFNEGMALTKDIWGALRSAGAPCQPDERDGPGRGYPPQCRSAQPGSG